MAAVSDIRLFFSDIRLFRPSKLGRLQETPVVHKNGLVKQRWAIIKREMEKISPKARQLAETFEQTNMREGWVAWTYDSSGKPTILPDSQAIEAWHKAIKSTGAVDTNRVPTAQVRAVCSI